MPKDLTGILLRRGALGDDDIERIVLARGYGDVLLRIAPLDAVGLTQVEVHGARDGLPCEDPALVEQLAAGGLAAFVHVNHTASQAVIHSFHPGGSQPGFAGSPGAEFDAKLRSEVGATLEAITAADDGSRIGIGIAASRTRALVRGRKLEVPLGTPTDLNTFKFHDRGADLDGRERLALFAFDAAALGRRLETPGRELAAHLAAAPRHAFGPLEGVRAQVVGELASLDERSMAAGGLRDVRAVELCALDEAVAFAGGDTVAYWDEHVLPLLSLIGGDPVVGPEDVEDLEDLSLLEALVEIMPSQAPPGGEGSMLASIGDGELGPLAPWARPGDEYAGTIFTLAPERLLDAARRFAGPQLGQLMEKLERAWYRAARPGQPEGDAFTTFRRALAEEGQRDVERALRDWAELRVVLELASANRLAVALFFYEA